MLTWEMLFMSCLLTYLLRPSKTQLFDKVGPSPPSLSFNSFSQYHLRNGSEAIVTYTNPNNNNNVDESKEEEVKTRDILCLMTCFEMKYSYLQIRHFDALTAR